MRVLTASGATYELLDTVRATGYLRVGSTAAPSNVTAGDLTALRAHFGTDAAFTAGYSLELNAARQRIGGTIGDSGADDLAFALTTTFNGTGDGPRAMHVAPTFSGNVALGGAYGMVFQPVFSPPTTRTYATIYGLYTQITYADAAGAVTIGITSFVGSPIISGALKPATHYGVYVANQGAASIVSAVGIAIVKPTNATNNYYMELNTADATPVASLTGRIPILIGGTLQYIPYGT
ncbi:MAG: hypothetical protein ACREXY_04920 [Gammaproteobacteria bacterium]